MPESTLPGGGVLIVDEYFGGASEDAESPVRLHVEIAQARSIARWRDQPNFQAWLRTYAEEAQLLETAIWDVMVSRFVDHAQGNSLDVLGAMVGAPRGPRNDARYRARIKAQIAVNSSLGRAPDILKIIRLLTDSAVRISDVGVAAFEVVFSEAVDAASAYELPSLIFAARAAGVGASVTIPQENPGVTAGSFIWGDIPTEAPLAGIGFGDLPAYPGTGGSVADYSRI